jgi:hypothetical protein
MTRFAAPLAAAALLFMPLAALADCGEEAREARERLEQLKGDPRRTEAEKLVEKAEKDHRAGRSKLCADAIKRVNVLLK